VGCLPVGINVTNNMHNRPYNELSSFIDLQQCIVRHIGGQLRAAFLHLLTEGKRKVMNN
jgi:hypothetical protein